jgi:hypothetical protein
MKTIPHRSEDYFPNKQLLLVYMWKVLMPLLLLLSLYSTYALILKVNHPLLRVAAQSELLILSALILMEAAIELREINSSYDKLLAICAILILLLFGVVKYFFYQSILSTTEQPSYIPPALWAFSFFNSAITLCSVVCSIYVFSIVSRELTTQRLMRLAL